MGEQWGSEHSGEESQQEAMHYENATVTPAFYPRQRQVGLRPAWSIY